MLSKARQKKIIEKLNRAQKAQFWSLKTWGQGGARGLDPHLSPLQRQR